MGDRGRRGIVQAVTGAGKTAVGAAAIKAHLEAGGSAVVLVPTIELMHQWREHLYKWVELPEERVGRLGGGFRDRLGGGGNSVIVAVAVSGAARLPEQVADSIRPVLLVADECHRYGAKSWAPALQAEYKATLGLSATPERPDLKHEAVVVPALGDIVYRLGYQEALRHGVISEFDVCFVALPFTTRERADYERYSEEITDRLETLRQRYPELQYSELLFEQLEELFEETNDLLIRGLQASVSKRLQTLFGASARMDFVEWLFSKVRPEGRTLLFHERIDECGRIAGILRELGIPAAAHHSKLSKAERQDVLRRFKRGSLHAVVAPRTLDEGIDVPDADLGVIVAGSKGVRQRIQRAGRVLRTAKKKDVARVLVLYVERSVEDPQARDADGFVESIEDLGRAHWYRWPLEAATLSSMFVATSGNED